MTKPDSSADLIPHQGLFTTRSSQTKKAFRSKTNQRQQEA